MPPILSASQRATIERVRKGARVVLLSDGWVGVEPVGESMAQISAERWAAMRAAAPDLPAPADMVREDAEAFGSRMFRPPMGIPVRQPAGSGARARLAYGGGRR